MKKNQIIIVIMFSVAVFLISSFNSCAKSPGNEVDLIEENVVYDAIIVPGVPYNDDYWTKILMARIHWANHLFKKGIAKNIIYSGSAVYTPYIEAEIMAMYGKELGIPAENIFTEINAEHSVENVYYSYQIAQKLGFKKVALATDPFQSRMMKGPSKRMKVDIDFIPFSMDMIDTLQVSDISIDADKAFVNDFVSLEERENFFQRLKGTIGRNIDYKD
jgi:uncharacterized SAM-binding protein YcdF (DUF218 family)